MAVPVSTIPWDPLLVPVEEPGPEPEPERLTAREWLVTNGLGGYASGTLSGIPTRRYHGLLIAALPAPVGRTLMLCQMDEVLRLPDHSVIHLGGHARAGRPADAPEADLLRELRLEAGLPVWRYETAGYVLEKRVFLVHQQNTAYVLYTLVQGPGVLRLDLELVDGAFEERIVSARFFRACGFHFWVPD